MSPAFLRAIAAWRKTALAVVQNPNTTPTQRALAWRFLGEHGVTA